MKIPVWRLYSIHYPLKVNTGCWLASRRLLLVLWCGFDNILLKASLMLWKRRVSSNLLSFISFYFCLFVPNSLKNNKMPFAICHTQYLAYSQTLASSGTPLRLFWRHSAWGNIAWSGQYVITVPLLLYLPTRNTAFSTFYPLSRNSITVFISL